MEKNVLSLRPGTKWPADRDRWSGTTGVSSGVESSDVEINLAFDLDFSLFFINYFLILTDQVP